MGKLINFRKPFAYQGFNLSPSERRGVIRKSAAKLLRASGSDVIAQAHPLVPGERNLNWKDVFLISNVDRDIDYVSKVVKLASEPKWDGKISGYVKNTFANFEIEFCEKESLQLISFKYMMNNFNPYPIPYTLDIISWTN